MRQQPAQGASTYTVEHGRRAQGGRTGGDLFQAVSVRPEADDGLDALGLQLGPGCVGAHEDERRHASRTGQRRQGMAPSPRSPPSP